MSLRRPFESTAMSVVTIVAGWTTLSSTEFSVKTRSPFWTCLRALSSSEIVPGSGSAGKSIGEIRLALSPGIEAATVPLRVRRRSTQDAPLLMTVAPELQISSG